MVCQVNSRRIQGKYFLILVNNFAELPRSKIKILRKKRILLIFLSPPKQGKIVI